jgi:ankyrin repeat protein
MNMSFTDIFAAAKEGTVEDVRYFVEEKGTSVYAKDANGRIPLHHATKSNSNVGILEYLVSQGADVKVKLNRSETLLHTAAMTYP